MKEKIAILQKRYREASTEKELQAVRDEMQALMDENSEAWAEGMLENLIETRKEAQQIVIRQKLEEIIPIISLSYIAEHYFKKTKSWLYQRLNENIVNNKPAKFTDEELKTLNFALQDISKKIGSVSIA